MAQPASALAAAAICEPQPSGAGSEPCSLAVATGVGVCLHRKRSMHRRTQVVNTPLAQRGRPRKADNDPQADPSCSIGMLHDTQARADRQFAHTTSVTGSGRNDDSGSNSDMGSSSSAGATSDDEEYSKTKQRCQQLQERQQQTLRRAGCALAEQMASPCLPPPVRFEADPSLSSSNYKAISIATQRSHIGLKFGEGLTHSRLNVHRHLAAPACSLLYTSLHGRHSIC